MEAAIVFVPDHPHANAGVLEFQSVVAVSVCREPEPFVDVFAVSFEFRESLLELRDGFARGLDYLQVLVVPDFP